MVVRDPDQIDDLLDWVNGQRKRPDAFTTVATASLLPAVATWFIVSALHLAGGVSTMAVVGIAWGIWSTGMIALAMVADGTPPKPKGGAAHA